MSLKRALVGLLVLVAVAGLSVVPALAQAQYTIRLAHSDAGGIEVPKQAGSIVFKHVVESESGGRIRVEIYPAAQLGSEKENFEAVQLGTVQMAIVSDGPLPGFIPEMMVFARPYAFKSRPVVWEVLDGWFGQELADLVLQRTGVRVLGWGDLGYRNFTSQGTPVRTPLDLAGKKYRTMENPAHMEMMRAMGASPTPIAWGETYSALQQGVVDGQENPLIAIRSSRLYEVQEYVTMDGHIFTPHFIFINERFYQSLPKDLQDVIRRAAIVSQQVQRGISAIYEVVNKEFLEAQGMTVIQLTPDEIRAFEEATAGPVWNYVVGQIGEEWPSKLERAIAEAEEKLGLR